MLLSRKVAVVVSFLTLPQNRCRSSQQLPRILREPKQARRLPTPDAARASRYLISHVGQRMLGYKVVGKWFLVVSRTPRQDLA